MMAFMTLNRKPGLITFELGSAPRLRWLSGERRLINIDTLASSIDPQELRRLFTRNPCTNDGPTFVLDRGAPGEIEAVLAKQTADAQAAFAEAEKEESKGFLDRLLAGSL